MARLGKRSLGYGREIGTPGRRSLLGTALNSTLPPSQISPKVSFGVSTHAQANLNRAKFNAKHGVATGGYVDWREYGARGERGINLVRWEPPSAGTARRAAGVAGAANTAKRRGGFGAGNSSLRYGGAALSGLIGVNAAGNAYSALQNGRIGSALANGAFAVGAGITSYQLAMGEGLMNDHFNKAVGWGARRIGNMGASIRNAERIAINNGKLKEFGKLGSGLIKAAKWLRG